MTENDTIVFSGSPEVAPENDEPLGFLGELISDSIGKLDSLKRSASTAILDLLEQNLRLGWYLEDARHYLRKEGTYVAWIEQTCPLSYGHTTRLRQLAKHFCRDSIDNSQRLKLGINIPGLIENGEHLRRQIAASQCGSMSDLFRYAGLLPDRPGPNDANGNGNGNGDHAQTRFKVFAGMLKSLEKKSMGVDPDRLSAQQKAQLCANLRPLADLYATLTGASHPEPQCRFSESDFR